MNNIKVVIPQGSYLDPLLFIVQINDLPFIIKNPNGSIYADDISICQYLIE